MGARDEKVCDGIGIIILKPLVSICHEQRRSSDMTTETDETHSRMDTRLSQERSVQFRDDGEWCAPASEYQIFPPC